MFRSLLHKAVLSFLVTLAAWMAVAWPLPRHVFSAIPFSHKPESRQVCAITPGDHLQLLYHFWLAHDMIAGRTPFFYNLYEFNTGSDAERWAPDAYYAPFSIVYAAGSTLAGPAFGWNLAGFASLWIGYIFAWLLARRFTQSNFAAASAALIALLLPFRLVTLFAGSPTGFAVAWVPLCAWGTDRAFRDNSVAGGCWAGLGILLAAMGDLHVFYFSLLSLPGWALLAWMRKPDFQWRDPGAWKRLGLAVLPLAALVVVAALLTLEAGRGVAASVMSEGRAEQEVRLFSPDAGGFFNSNTGHAPNAFIFIGMALPAFLCVALVVAVVFCARKGRSHCRSQAVFFVVCAGLLFCAVLALGPRGPARGFAFSACRALLPKYEMIRQSSKIFALMPALLVVASALGMEFFRDIRLPRLVRTAAPAVIFACLLGMTYVPSMTPGLCRLDFAQPAYAEVSADAAKTGHLAHAMAVPLWPGDAHDSSLYQYYASLYRIRLINGYSPKVGRDYVENVFYRFESVNAGCLNDGQLDELLSRGVRYIILHEDHFPDKASPFPVAYAISRFLDHPRMRLVARDKRVWAFCLLDKPENRFNAWPDWNYFFPARSWDAASPQTARSSIKLSDAARAEDDPESWAGRIVRLAVPGAALETRGIGAPASEDLRWLLRVRGYGALAGTFRVNGKLLQMPDKLSVTSMDWTWLELAMPSLTNFSVVSLRLEQADGGAVCWDTARLICGRWRMPAIGETVSWQPARFFHAGYMDEKSGSVHFEAAYDREGVVLYGPKLPLHPGRYRLVLEHASPATAGTLLGRINIQWRERAQPDWKELVAGAPTIIEFDQKNNLPFFFIFMFLREADMELNLIRLTRLS